MCTSAWTVAPSDSKPQGNCVASSQHCIMEFRPGASMPNHAQGG
jgi:hypothetical protein